jgi:cyclomaltodextrinase
MTVPAWVADAVFYQIFPDRFANGDLSNDPPNNQRWGSPPTNWGFQGGDLRGIMQHFDYLLDLGINAIYLNPIFQSSSNHRYNTIDYYKIDPKLGDIKDFLSFLEMAHRNNIHVILDGVFNHCGRGFFAFNDLLENEEHSPYRDWFHTSSYPLDAYSPGEAKNFEGWWKLKSLPKFNTNNQTVRKYLFDIARHWINLGVDGWRLDVPNEINDDTFWEEFRSVINNTNKDAYIMGEIWIADPRWLNNKHFDGLMNYPLRDALLRLLHLGVNDLPHFVNKVEELTKIYPTDNVNSMYNLLGSHDTERLFTKVKCDTQKTKLAFFFLFSFPGAPSIYYGDEVGLEGEKDPDCRRAFIWERSSWNLELFYWVQNLISLRKILTPLKRGKLISIHLDNTIGSYVFSRNFMDEAIVTVLNFSDQINQIKFPVYETGWHGNHQVKDILTNKEYNIVDSSISITLQPWSGTWLS